MKEGWAGKGSGGRFVLLREPAGVDPGRGGRGPVRARRRKFKRRQKFREQDRPTTFRLAKCGKTCRKAEFTGFGSML
nr:hypothetical protein [Bacillaceae bacterium]